MSPAFWNRVNLTGPCWEWTGHRTKLGYGQLSVNSKLQYAHRVAYALAWGEPTGVVRHACDNPACCRPSHLIDGTMADNTADMMKRERCHAPKLSYRKAEAIRQMYATGVSQRSVAKAFGISQRMVGNIVRNKSWRSYV